MTDSSKTSSRWPRTIIIMRHGERLDHVDGSWAHDAQRPHDAPLTDEGHAMAHKAGAFVAKHGILTEAMLKDDKVHVFSSQLMRCVQTADGFCRGAEKQFLATSSNTQPQQRKSFKIRIEPSLTEGTYWVMRDMKHAARFAEGFPEPIEKTCPNPLFYPPEQMARVTGSPRLVMDPLADATIDAEKAKAMEQGVQAQGFYVALYGVGPLKATSAFYPVRYLLDKKKGRLSENFETGQRCSYAASKLISGGSHLAQFFGESASGGGDASSAPSAAVLVGHGQTTVCWYNGIMESCRRKASRALAEWNKHHPQQQHQITDAVKLAQLQETSGSKHLSPSYTGLAILRCVPCPFLPPEIAESVPWYVDDVVETFATPHEAMPDQRDK